MILGSHNSFTYLKPTSLLQRFITMTWKCQNVNIKTQYALGVRCFDFRLCWHKNQWCSSHGYAKFIVNFDEILSWLNLQTQDKIYIRVVLESGNEEIEQKFIDVCDTWEHKYTNLIFFEGTKKSTWQRLYKFAFTPIIEQFVSSMLETNIIKKILPKRYAKKYNKQNYHEALFLPYDKICLFDFVDINLTY